MIADGSKAIEPPRKEIEGKKQYSLPVCINIVLGQESTQIEN